MTITGLTQLDAMLDLVPVAFSGNTLNLILLEDVTIVTDIKQYLRCVGAPDMMPERRECILDAQSGHTLPCARIQERPDPWQLTKALAKRFGSVDGLIPTQDQIGDLLVRLADASRADIVMLMIVDGLSYYDLPVGVGAAPVMVNGPSITPFGFTAVIGRPSVSQRLFARGYKHQLGITFFDAESPLSGGIYSAFGGSQIRQVRSTQECNASIVNAGMSRGYIQITAPGLDGICHNHRDSPPREKYLETLLDRFHSSFDLLRTGGRRVVACLTSDHGIMWRHDFEQYLTVMPQALPSRDHPRYVQSALIREHSCIARDHEGRPHTLLTEGYVTRRLRATEWGVHGGVSAWESLVPLVIRDSVLQ